MTGALRIAFGAVIIAIIAFGFYLTGSPAENKVLRRDELRVQDLNKLGNLIRNYHSHEGEVPDSLQSILDACKGKSKYWCVGLQVMDSEGFELIVDDAKTYQLCATFERAAPLSGNLNRSATKPSRHDAGRQCYSYDFPK